MLGINILSSLLLGSAVSSVLTNFLMTRYHLNFFTSNLSQQLFAIDQSLAIAKTSDFINMAIFFGVSLTLFLVNHYFTRDKNNLLAKLFYATFAILIFFQTTFVVHSGTQTIFLTLIAQTIYLILAKPKTRLPKEINWKSAMSGSMMGYFLLIFTNGLFGSYVIPFLLFGMSPVIYIYIETKFPRITSNPSHIILILASLFPFNYFALSAIFLVFAISTIVIDKYVSEKHTHKLDILFPFGVIFILVYNPLFYLGNYDSVEEGIWTAWLHRMLNGESLYKDFTAYHPPLFPWGNYLFSKLTAASLYSTRYFFHLLAVLGSFILYFSFSKAVKSKLLVVLGMVLIIIFATSGVRNNAEIRVGLGMLALLPLYYFAKGKSIKYAFLSGLLTTLSLFASTEVGVATLASLTISLTILSKILKTGFLRTIAHYYLGVLIGSIPVALVMAINGSLFAYVTNISYMLRAFSSGFQNVSITHPEQSNLLLWQEVYGAIGSSAIFWELSRFVLAGSIMFMIYTLLSKKWSPKDLYAVSISIFAILLLRPAMGRSDIYHLNSVLIISVILISYLLEKFTPKKNYLAPVALIIISIVFVGKDIHTEFAHQQLLKFQTFGKLPGIYPSYTNPRFGITPYPGTDTKMEESMITYITENTSYSDPIFVFTHNPELYFLTNRNNATKYDTPLMYIDESHQREMIIQLQSTKPKLIIYNPSSTISETNVEYFANVNNFILENYEEIQEFGDWSILEEK